MLSSSLATSPGVDLAMRTKSISSIMEIKCLAILLIQLHHLLLKRNSFSDFPVGLGEKPRNQSYHNWQVKFCGPAMMMGMRRFFYLEPENPLKRIWNDCSCGWCMCLQGGGGGAWRDPCRQDPQVVHILTSSTVFMKDIKVFKRNINLYKQDGTTSFGCLPL